jgi:hypothetical protein
MSKKDYSPVALRSSTPSSDGYLEWQSKVRVLSTATSYLSLAFLCLHPLILAVAYDHWAEKNPLLIAHSVQQGVLALYIGALPDPRYQHFLRPRLWLFYLLAAFNLLLALLVLAGGTLFYVQGPALYSFIAVGLMTYVVIASGPLLAAIVAAIVLIQVMFYERPKTLQGGGILEMGEIKKV